MLSEQDVQLLLQAKSSPEARAAVASKVAATFADEALTAQELALAQDIIRAMVNDISVDVRRALAENLKGAPQMPREVAMKLAQDVDSVALPILQFSTVLTDDDLVLVIGSSGDSKQQAIARREIISPAVAGVLVEKGTEQVISTLVSNRGAEISDQSLQLVVDRYGNSEPIQNGLVQRERLPLLVAEQLVSRVSEGLRDYLVSKHELKTETVADILLSSRERAVVAISSRASTARDVEKLVAQMNANGRLTPSLVLRALCTGDLGFFEAALAIRANVPLVNARLLIHDAGRLGLKSIYDKAMLPEKFLPAIRVALDVMHETAMDGGSHDHERFRSRIIERILTQYYDLPEEDLNYLIGKIENYGSEAA